MATVNPKWEMLLRDFEEVNDKALAWLQASWTKKGEDKEICLLHYKKWKKEVNKIVLQMNEMAQNKKIVL